MPYTPYFLLLASDFKQEEVWKIVIANCTHMKIYTQRIYLQVYKDTYAKKAPAN